MVGAGRGFSSLALDLGDRRRRDQLHVYVRYVPDKGKEGKILDRAVGTPGVFSSSSFPPRNINIFLGSGVSNFNEIFSRVSSFFPEHRDFVRAFLNPAALDFPLLPFQVLFSEFRAEKKGEEGFVVLCAEGEMGNEDAPRTHA